MKLSVIIPTYNRKEELIKTLKAFARQTYRDFEIIVVDDGGRDGTKESIKKLESPLKIRYLYQEKKGPASARNLGVKNCQSEIIFFTGDDIIPAENLLEEHFKLHQSGKENLVVLGYTKWASNIKITPFRKYIGDYHFAYSRITDSNNVNWRYFYTSNISLSRSFLEKIELFDEEFLYPAYEDSELAYRLSGQGMQMVFNKEAVAYHNHPMDFKSYQKTMFNRGRSLIILAKKVPTLGKALGCPETKNPVRLFFKRLILNNFIVVVLIEVICFLDKLMIPLPELIYSKILNYSRAKGIKESK